MQMQQPKESDPTMNRRSRMAIPHPTTSRKLAFLDGTQPRTSPLVNQSRLNRRVLARDKHHSGTIDCGLKHDGTRNTRLIVPFGQRSKFETGWLVMAMRN